MSKNDELLLNCSMDLQRAAVALYQNPYGKTHIRFLRHALDLLADRKSKEKQVLNKMFQRLQTGVRKTYARKLSDKLLTIGLMLKPRI